MILICWRYFTFPCLSFPMSFPKCLSNILDHHPAQGSLVAGSPSRRCCNTNMEQLILSFVNSIKTFEGLSLDLASLGSVDESVCLFSLACFVSNPGLSAVFPRFSLKAPVPLCIIFWLSTAVLTSYLISHATFLLRRRK